MTREKAGRRRNAGFVAGATGVLGRALVPQLLAAGHTVVGLARTPEKLLQADILGATPVRGDVLDGEAMRRVVGESQAEAVVNLASAIPLKLRVHPKDWELNDRVRLEGTRNLLAASEPLGLRLFVQESVGYVCASRGADWIDEEAPRSTHPFLRATLAMEDLVRASRLPATLLRFAALSSPHSWHTQQSIAALRRGLLPIIGEGDAYVSQIHADDAARGIVAALANVEASSGQTFNLVDNDPAPMRDVLTCAAQTLRAGTPRHASALMAKMIVGALTVEVLTASYRMTNAKARRVLNFAPRYPNYRECWAQIAREIGARDFTPSKDLGR